MGKRDLHEGRSFFCDLIIIGGVYMGEEKIILRGGPLLRCVHPKCNIDTNARYDCGGEWIPACMRAHLPAQSAIKKGLKAA